MHKMKPYVCLFLATSMALPPAGFAASHREAPITALDQKADITDFFAFVSYDDPTKVTFILNVDPLLEPGNGPNYFPFDDNIQYAINIDNNNDANAERFFSDSIQYQYSGSWSLHRLCRRRQRNQRAGQFPCAGCAWNAHHSSGHHCTHGSWRGGSEP